MYNNQSRPPRREPTYHERERQKIRDLERVHRLIEEHVRNRPDNSEPRIDLRGLFLLMNQRPFIPPFWDGVELPLCEKLFYNPYLL